MIRQIQQSAPADSSQATTPTPAKTATTGKSFARLHAAALQRVAADSAASTAAAGETWESVAGKPNMAKIVTGDRAGEYVNLSGGARHGEIFKVEQQGGKTVHVYGSGNDEQVIDASKDHAVDARPSAGQRAPKGETWQPIAGHADYADILGGPRDGYYVNTSGNSREGQAFQIVRKNGHTFHVYGVGKQARWIPIRGYEAPSAGKGKSAGGTSSPSGGTAAHAASGASSVKAAGTGGVSAPSGSGKKA